VAIVILAALAAAAETYAAPLDLPKAAKVEMVVVKTREDVRAGKTTRNSGETRYDKTIEVQGDGYRVTLKPTSVKLPQTPATAKAEAAMSGLMAMTFNYTADDSLRPTAVEDWPKLMAEVRKSMQTLAGDSPEAAKAMDAAVSMFSGMSAEQAASVFLKEDGFLSIPINVELEPGKPVTTEDSIPSPLGGPPIKADTALVLQKVDAARGVAALRWTQTLDPESTRASIAQMMQAMMARMGPEANKPEAKAMFEKMSFDRSSACDYEVDMKTGLTLKADCESKLSLTDPTTGETGGRNEYWAITQTLKN
jgi:hypothetical protein